MAIGKQAIKIIGILLIFNIYELSSTSSKEYCQSNQCDSDDPNGFHPNLTDEEAVQEYIKRYGVDRLDNFIKARLDNNRNTKLKIAVTGASGSGKSTFINTIRGLLPDDTDAASVGSIETTDEIQIYSHPTHPNLEFYDLPGVGTRKYPKEKYLELVDYKRYDFFIIVNSKRFTENDEWLAQEVKKYGKVFFLVRTKVNEDLINEQRDHPKTFNEEEVMKKIRKDCSKNIKATDPTAKTFLISGLLEHTNKFDYSVMEQTLNASFPAYKRQALISSMTSSSKEEVEAKVKVLKSKVWMIGILSGGIAAIPVPGLSFVVDYALITDTISDYKNQLGVDDVSLQRLAKSHNLSLAEINEKLTGGWVDDLLKNDVKNYVMRSLSKYAIENTVKEFGRFIPVAGLGIAAVTTTTTTMAVLHNALDEMLRGTLSIIDLIK